MWLIVVWTVAGCWLIVAAVVRRADDFR
jgi:hypothetical protein